MEHGGGSSGGGGIPAGSVGPPNFFLAPIDASASVDIDQTATNYLEITAANVITNRGDAFMVEDGTNSNQRVKCLISGNYTILVGMAIDGPTTGNDRSNIVSQIDVKRGATAVAGTGFEQGFYLRDTVPVANAISSLTVDLEVDDLIEMLFYRQADRPGSVIFGGENSFISIVQNGAAGAKGDMGDPGEDSIIDVSGVDLEVVDEDDKGTVWLDTYQHDMSFAVRRFRATTEATGTGTDIADIDFTQNDRPRPTASGEVWFKPANDNVTSAGTGNIWFSTQWRFSSVSTALSLPYTGFTSVEYIGQYDTPDDAANSIPAADYAATTQYIFYDRDDARIKYLSAYVAPGTQVEYWDVLHVLTDENRLTPHPVADEFTGTLVSDRRRTSAIRASSSRPLAGSSCMVGDHFDADSFSIHIPVSLIAGRPDGDTAADD